MSAEFARSGLSTADEIRDLGAEEAYRHLLAAGMRPHFIGFYALAMGLQGRPWNDCRGAEKARLRETFDRIVADIRSKKAPETDAFALTRELDALGIGLVAVQPTSSRPEKK